MGILEWSISARIPFLYLSICLSIPSAMLYIAQIVTILRHKQFHNSFYALFIIRAIPDLLYLLDSYYCYRLTVLFGSVLYPVYTMLPNWMIGLSFFFTGYTFQANNLATAFILLNRLSAIAMPIKHEKLWQKFLPLVAIVVFAVPICINWKMFKMNGVLKIENDGPSDLSFFLYENGEAFNRFGHGSFSPELFLSALFRWLISLPGLFFNASLLYTILHEKNFRGTCATLLAVGSLCDFFFLLAFSVPFVVALSGQNVISNFCCYFVQLLPVIGLYTSVWIVFFVGFDRLIAVLFPIRYNFLETKLFLYISPMLTLSFGYSIAVTVAASYWTLFLYPDWPVICTHNDMFIHGMSSTMLQIGLMLNGASLLCYVFVGLALFRCWRKNPHSVDKHRIFNSLAAIMTLVVGTYFTICAVRLLIAPIKDPFFLLHISPSISALLTCAAASSNAPLLFAFSSEYRVAFCKHLSRWPLIGKWLQNWAASEQQRRQIVAATANCDVLQNRRRIIHLPIATTQMRMTTIE